MSNDPGSGLRWAMDQMSDEEARDVEEEISTSLASKGVDRVATNVIYAIARRSVDPT